MNNELKKKTKKEMTNYLKSIRVCIRIREWGAYEEKKFMDIYIWNHNHYYWID